MNQNSDLERAEWEARAVPTLRAREALWRQEHLDASPAGRLPIMEEVLDLGLHVPLSYDPFPAPWRMIQDVVETVREQIIRPMLEECIKVGLVKEDEIDEALLHGITALKGWALACLGLGAERGFGTLSQQNGNRCLNTASHVYALFAMAPLIALLNHDFLTDAEANVHVGLMGNTIARCGNQAAALGFEGRSGLQRRDDRFLKAVERFSELREE